MVDLPAPIMPTSTTERVPSAAEISASWDALALAGETVSGIEEITLSPPDCSALRHLYYRRRAGCQRVLQGSGEHVGSHARFQWLIRCRGELMPSLFRFLTVVAMIGGIVYGVIFSLANFVNPKPREMTVTIPADKFLKK
jgi:hypothetical protein